MHERGPQALQPIVDEFFRRTRDIVISYDGIVDHFLGDAVLALFNVPIRHDDHSERAVKAAMDIQAAIPAINAAIGEAGLLKVGVGISTGLAYCGAVGSDNCLDYTALGDAVNIASRLQGEAAPGEVLATKEIYEIVEDGFPLVATRSVQLKGISEPVVAYSLGQVQG